METPSVRVLVLGDSGVGKTTLLRSICRSNAPPLSSNDKPATLLTTGCDVHVLLTSLRLEREVFVEFLDVGGHRKYELSRGAFYHDVHGVMFVHDLSNVKSGEHLRNWSGELSRMQRLKGCVVPSTGQEQDFPSLKNLPKLVVGNKRDLLPRNHRPTTTGPMAFPEFRTATCIESCAEPLAMEPRGALDAFLQQTVAFANRGDGGGGFNSYSSSGNLVGLRQTASRTVDQGDGRASGLSAGLSSLAAALPPLSTGSGSARSRWW